MGDRIKIKDLLLRCIVGINEWERKEKQDVIINLEVFLDLKEAGKKDNIEYTLDYKKLKKEIIDIVESSSPYLIENLAYKIADLCIRKERVKKVIVEVDKPGALRFSRSVSVQIEREWKTYLISIGSNINPQENIKEAINRISKIDELKLEKISSFYETPAIGEDGNYDFKSPKFINGILKTKTFLEKHELEERLDEIEKALGRKEKGNWKPRTIDLDIIFIKDSESNIKFLHKDVFERDFIFFPSLELEHDVLKIISHPKEKWIEKLQSGIIRKVEIF